MLKRSRWLLLKRPEKLTGEQRGRLAELVRRNLRTVRAYLLKEDFQSLWGYVSPYWAGQFLDRWCTRTMRSRLDPMKEVARMVALAPRPDSELVPSPGAVLQWRCRRLQRKGQSDHQTGVWVPHLRGTGSRFVSRTWRPARTKTHPQILLTRQEGQVDYGEGPMVRDADSGKYRRTRLFVLTLGYSRKAVRLLVPRSSAQVWAELHERAFRRLGGTVRVVVLDNLKEGVLTPDIYDPTLNPLYRDVLAHYGVVALPCRVGDPDRKGKVEAAVGHAQKTPLRGLRFERLDVAQAYLDRWERRWADTRIHGTTKRQVAAMFAEERPALGPLPIEPFRYYQYGRRTVHLDGCVEVASAYYSAPPGWIGRRVDVQWNGAHVRLLDPRTGQLLREHLRAPRGWHRIADPDRPARTRHPRPSPCSPPPSAPAPPSPRSATTSTATTAPPASAASSASSPSPESTVPPSSNRPPTPPSNSGSPPIGSCGATSTAGPRRPSRCVRSTPSSGN